ncbi:TPA: hypothetical protein ACRIDK_000716 [Legionella anisa]
MHQCFHFLVIEDSMAVRIVIRTQLTNLGQKVDMASTMEEVLERVTSSSYDMILMSKSFYHRLFDIEQFLTLISKEKRTNNRPVIGVMGNDSFQNDVLKSFHYFPNPFTKENSLKIIDFLSKCSKKMNSERE